MNDVVMVLSLAQPPELTSALCWALFHTVWVGAFSAVLLRGGLDLLPRDCTRRRYGLAVAALLALPLAFGVSLWRQFQPVPMPPISQWIDAHSVAEGLPAMAAPSALDSAREWLTERARPLEPWLVGAWALVVAVLFVRLAGAWAWCLRFRRLDAHPAEPMLQVRVARLGRRLGLRRRARLFLSDAIDVPMVLGSGLGSGLAPGAGRAAIVLPFRALRELDARDLDGLLAHELAHVKRLDGPVHLVQAAIEAAFFFHPAAHWIGARVRAEREHCCDELAIAACGGPHVLARALARLEEQRSRSAFRHAPAIALAASDGCLVTRVERLLGRGSPPARRAVGTAFALAGLAGLAVAGYVRPGASHSAHGTFALRAGANDVLPLLDLADRPGGASGLANLALEREIDAEGAGPSVRGHRRFVHAPLAGDSHRIELRMVAELDTEGEWSTRLTHDEALLERAGNVWVELRTSEDAVLMPHRKGERTR